MKENRNIFFAGQITGVEGYVESISSGFVAGINAVKLFELYKDTEIDIYNKYKENKIVYNNETVIGALAQYISMPNDNFQPMNANFGILPSLEEKIKDKKERYSVLAERSLQKIKNQT